jgi:type I restriction enzyme S subunit
MSSDDSVIPLGELIKHKKGFAFKSKDYITSGVAVIRVSNFSDDSINPNDLKFVSGEISLTNQDVALRANDIVVATVGSWPNNPASVVGRTISVPKWADGALMNQNAVILRSKSANFHDQKFIYHQMKTLDFSTHLISKAQGSANQASITLDAIFSYPMKWPEFEHRKSIAETLSALDDRIALLRETNTTLEAIAQALFKSWFVDFDPVHAKQQGREPEGMDASTAALFPDSFEESKLGLVPMGWRVGKVEQLLELAYGKALKATDRIAGIIPVYGSGGVTGYHNEALVNTPSIVIGRKGTVGSLYWEDRPFFPIDTVFYVKTKEPLTYCFYQLQLLGMKDMNTDGAVPGLNRNNVYRLPIILPSHEALLAFDEIVSPLRQKIFTNSEQAQTLANLRDTLLPRLISGQLRLPDSAPA